MLSKIKRKIEGGGPSTLLLAVILMTNIYDIATSLLESFLRLGMYLSCHLSSGPAPGEVGDGLKLCAISVSAAEYCLFPNILV